MPEIGAVFLGVIVGLVLVAAGYAVSDITERNTYQDIRDQCERQGSIRLGKEAFFYCAREPVKK